VLYAVVFLCVAAQYSTDDVIATVTYSGRDSRLLETLGARTARLFPLRVRVSGQATPAELVRQVQSAFMCGAMASRAPFTAERAIEQALGGRPPGTSVLGRRDGGEHGMHLFVVENRVTRRGPLLTTPRLSAERIYLAERPYEGVEPDDLDPFGDDPLAILLLRDSAEDARRPVVFSAGFYTHVIDESDVRRLVGRMSLMARMCTPEHCDMAVAELIERITSRTARYPASARSLSDGRPGAA